MHWRTTLATLIAVSVGAYVAWAQPFQQPGGSTVPPAVQMCYNGTTNADGSRVVVPCTGSGAPSVTVVAPIFTPSAPATANAGKLANWYTAQNLFTAGEVVHGCVITNPGNATDQNIATAEEIWVDFVATAQRIANSTSIPIAVGQSIGCAGGSTLAVSWNAYTINHYISAYKW